MTFWDNFWALIIAIQICFIIGIAALFINAFYQKHIAFKKQRKTGLVHTLSGVNHKLYEINADQRAEIINQRNEILSLQEELNNEYISCIGLQKDFAYINARLKEELKNKIFAPIVSTNKSFGNHDATSIEGLERKDYHIPYDHMSDLEYRAQVIEEMKAESEYKPPNSSPSKGLMQTIGEKFKTFSPYDSVLESTKNDLPKSIDYYIDIANNEAKRMVTQNE